jgi:predicted NBD/HSP70 family sugar kinase
MKPIIVDIGATNIRAGNISTPATPLFVAPTPINQEDLLCDIFAAIQTVKEKTPEANCIILGCAGLVTNSGRVQHALALNLSDIDLPYITEKKFNLPTTVLNDANLQALAFQPERDHVLYLCIGSGIGGALILDGKLYTGENGFAGELGHIPFFNELESFSLKQSGNLDNIASGLAIERLLSPRWWDFPITHKESLVLKTAGRCTGRVIATTARLLNISFAVVCGHVTDYEIFQSAVQTEANNISTELNVLFQNNTWENVVYGARTLIDL